MPRQSVHLHGVGAWVVVVVAQGVAGGGFSLQNVLTNGSDRRGHVISSPDALTLVPREKVGSIIAKQHML